MKNILFKVILCLMIFGGINCAFAKSKYNAGKPKVHHNKKHKKTKPTKNKNYMRGIASYYGEDDGFEGKQMANGQKYNASDVYAAAHPTLPLGTKLMVTNLVNGRMIYVEVKDRMPRGNRAIDLSVAAAKYLGMHRRGITKVQLVKVSNQEFENNKRYLTVNDSDSGAQG